MPCELSKSCAACGVGAELLQCDTCKARLKDKGISQALCKKCHDDPEELVMFGKSITSGFLCNPCSKFLVRAEQEKLFAKLKEPSSEQVLRTVSSKYPWALTIAQASPDELLEALQFCKRKLSGHRTVAALADSLANNNSHAALLLQNLGGVASTQDTLTSKALRTFVKNQCPSIKYKALLLPPQGSIHKATRHIQEMLRVGRPPGRGTCS